MPYDEWGKEYTIDSQGRKQIPMKTNNSTCENGFTTYDTSHGHCGFCGQLTCNGGCFK